MIDIDKANRTAVEQMTSARPVLKGVATARDVIPGMKDNLLLHAGPPITWERASGPMQGAIIGALLLEGLAKSKDDAIAMVKNGEIELDPCHHHQSVGPMAGVTSASMKVYVVENETHGNQAYSSFNEGYGKVLRYGAYSDEVIRKLRWMNDVMGPVLADALAASDGIDIRALLAEGLHMGDEGHNRNKAGSIIFTTRLAPLIVKATDKGDNGRGGCHGKCPDAGGFRYGAVPNVAAGVFRSISGEIESIGLPNRTGKPPVVQAANPNAKIRAVTGHGSDNGAAFDAVGSIAHRFASCHNWVQNAERIVAKELQNG